MRLRITQIEAAAGFQKGADGSHYPTVGSFLVDDATLPYIVTVHLGVAAGKPICRKLTAEQRSGGAPVTRRGLNAIPIGRIIEEVAQRWAIQINESAKTARFSTTGEKDRIKQSMRPDRGRRGDPDARRLLVERVATLYNELVEQQIKHPKPAIAKELGYSASYIGALVAEARASVPPLIAKPTGPGRASAAAPAPKRRSSARKDS
jgi:hypothetical protein